MKTQIIALVFVTSFGLASDAKAQSNGQSLQRLDKPLSASAEAYQRRRADRMQNAEKSTIIVRLKTPPLAQGAALDEVQQAAWRASIMEEQEGFLSRCLNLPGDIRVLARTTNVLNAIFVELDTNLLEALSEDTAVQRIAPVADYDLMLSETVPYIGAARAQAAGFDGFGIRVAVLDSGIDYMHIKFGGSGDPADFAANDPSVIELGSFPTAKVVGGADFTGSAWPNGDLAPDGDPLDDGPGGGHGTHVADIIGGSNGVAPASWLYAVKVCSSVSSSCSGIALIQGMDFAADPNGDGNLNDHVDIINMSLGSDYGQPFDDDLSAAVENATLVGILTVAAAGNGGDRPYVAGTPAATRSALSVAQTQVPSAELNLMEVTAPAGAVGEYLAVFQPWSTPLAATVQGSVQYADGAGGNLNGCAPFAPGTLTGLIVFVDRGACNFSDKIRNIEDAGGILGIIGLVTPGDPFPGGFGGGAPIGIPGFMISQSDADPLRTGTAAIIFDPTNVKSLAGSMVSSSSRGPRNFDNGIKPDIGAPGASVSAEYGTGTGETPFGGTSGASPMVAGSAALVLQARQLIQARPLPFELKALLANTADENIANDSFDTPAPITRIGSGEVRVDHAIQAPAAAWDDETGTPSLSFGFVDVKKKKWRKTRRIRVRNYTSRTRTYQLSNTFGDDGDDTGAVSIKTPNRVRVRAHSEKTFAVKITVHGENLPANSMSSGSVGSDPSTLTANEFDGLIMLDDGSHPIHVPWHILPRQAADVRSNRNRLNFNQHGNANIRLRNKGPGVAQNEVFTLLSASGEIPEGPLGGQSPTPDLRALAVNTEEVPAGFCSADPSFIWRFAVASWERQTHLLPVIYEVALDTNRDGTDDFVVLNLDFSFLVGGGLDGRQLTGSVDLATDVLDAFFFAEHSMNTANTVLTICAEQVGLTGADFGVTPVDVRVNAFDFYFGGPGDAIGAVTYTPGAEAYVGDVDDIPGGDHAQLTVEDRGQHFGDDPQLGIMVVTNSDRGAGARGGATANTEAILLTPPNVFLP